MSRTKIIADLEKLMGHLLDEARQTQSAMQEREADGVGWNYHHVDRHAMSAEIKILRKTALCIEIIIENNSSEETITSTE